MTQSTPQDTVKDVDCAFSGGGGAGSSHAGEAVPVLVREPGRASGVDVVTGSHPALGIE